MGPESRDRYARFFRQEDNGDRIRPVRGHIVVAAPNHELTLGLAADDICKLQGAFGAMALVFAILVNPGDEGVIPAKAYR